MKSKKLSAGARLALVVCAVLLGISIAVPLWRIELVAPQYPEGLALLIYPGKLGGNVDIINGLNHYIGMQTLHADNFIEFTILPWLLGGFAILMLVSAGCNRKKWLYISFISFIIFGIVSMVDFYRWEYNYGHNLDPNAAIIVPGMAYQPPLIGYKKLLNFEAFSIPALGGWLIVGVGVLLLAATITEAGWFRRKIKKGLPVLLLAMVVFVSGCGSSGPDPVLLHTDHCSNCKMGISDTRFAAEIITVKGRVYKFDDWHCMMAWQKQNPNPAVKNFYIHDYVTPHAFLEVSTAFFVRDASVKSPMGGNVAAFSTRGSADSFAASAGTDVLRFSDLSDTP